MEGPFEYAIDCSGTTAVERTLEPELAARLAADAQRARAAAAAAGRRDAALHRLRLRAWHDQDVADLLTVLGVDLNGSGG